MDCISGGSNMNEITLSRETIVSYYRNCNTNKDSEKMEYMYAKVREALNLEDLSPAVKHTLQKMIYKYKEKYEKSHKNIDRCKSANKDWFEGRITFPVPVRQTSARSSSGRPSKAFEDCAERTKRKRTEDVRKHHSPSELAFAAHMQYRAAGDLKRSKLIKNITIGQPTNVKQHGEMPAAKALSLFIENNLTKHQYNGMRKAALEMGCNLYPNYETITEEKKKCYPPEIICTETKAGVSLQNLLNKTTERLMLSISEVIESLDSNVRQHLQLIWKWGSDGSGSHSQYKQKFSEEGATDEYMLVTSIVPIRLVVITTKLLVWQNPRPSSTRYCRPLRLQMAHENTVISKEEAKNVQDQIEQLLPTVCADDWCVKHVLKLTMVDGKMINALTDTSSAMRCYLCSLTSKDFNNINKCLMKPIRTENLEYGISSLHAWIRFAECVLHLAYRLKLGRWQARGKVNQKLVNDEKKRIQKEFESKLGLHVDKPRQGGGTSTDGNTARAIFKYADEVADITGVNRNIILKFRTILRVLSSGYNIEPQKFKEFCHRTAASFTINYPWFAMPTTVHKVLIHGYLIVDHMGIAIGLLSEDAQESRNKDVRNYRENFSRKFSRKIAMEDTYNRLLVSSDPYITGLRSLVPKKTSEIMTEIELGLLSEDSHQ